jgi:lipopolysaccharide/colanic/teichoic acid biosynthesis glycosyltransferase
MDAVALPAKPLAYRMAKRAFDVVFSLAAIMVGLVPCLALSACIALDTRAFPIYRQKRVGMGGREFTLYKFRTMVSDSDDVDKYLSPEQLAQWRSERKVDNDPRITPLGRILRSCSIDELPNFINVFLGDMSVIGPRAITVDELGKFGADAAALLTVPCGITGWWQVNARNNASFETGERQELELYYVGHASAALDTEIFLRTFGVMFGRNRTGR